MRTWITGIGVVSPLGLDATSTMRALFAGKRAQGPITLFDVAELRAKLGAEVPGFVMSDVVPAARSGLFSRSDALALVAVREALAHARVPASASVDLVVGATTGGLFQTEGRIAAFDPLVKQGGLGLTAALEEAASDPLLRMHPVSATADRLAEAAFPFRRRRTVCSACSSSANAIAIADAWIRAGRSEIVLAGGTDALCRLTFLGFNLLQAMDPAPCRPFDAKRAGMNLGEAAAFLVIESEASARRRGADPIAELAGWAIGSEAHHITNPEAEGTTAARLMRRALGRAGLAPSDIGYVNAHGTATPHNDRMEAAALADVLGPRLADVLISSSKGQIGHTLGAAGAIEAAITAVALARQTFPPSAGLEAPDPAFSPMKHVIGPAVSARVDAALSSSFGFGGSNTVLAITRPEAFPAPVRPALRSPVALGGAWLGPDGPKTTANAADLSRPGAALPEEAGAAAAWAKRLDPDKARRMDRGGALVTSTCDEAMRAANAPATVPADRVGLVTGIAFRREEDFAAFLNPILERGFRAGKPAVFPNLLLSSPAGHASIYLGIRGPVLTTTDLTLSASTALLSAIDLVVHDEADVAVATALTERDRIVEDALAPATCGPDVWGEPRATAATGLTIAARAAPDAGLGAKDAAGDPKPQTFDPAAAVEICAWDEGTDRSGWTMPRPATDRAIVLFSRRNDVTRALAAQSGWVRSADAGNDAAIACPADRAGANEAAAGVAFLAACGAILAGDADEALVIDGWREPFPAEGAPAERWAAFVFRRARVAERA